MVDAATLEASCVRQIRGFLDHPAFTNPVAIMADSHAGAGAVIGFTMRMTPKVIPNVIGVDIGCGMVSLELGSDLRVAHAQVDTFVRAHVPFGFHRHSRPQLDPETGFPWVLLNERAEAVVAVLQQELGLKARPPNYSLEWLDAKCAQLGVKLNAVLTSVGTLGGGNHFIEIGESERTGALWVTLHTGSRNFGKRVAEYWQWQAEKHQAGHGKENWLAQVAALKARLAPGPELGKALETARLAHVEAGGGVAKGLEWLSEEDLPGYLFDMLFAQVFASLNRQTIGEILLQALGAEARDRIESVHNFVDFDDLMLRKGAIRAYAGERMIIPFNMRDGVLLCEGRSASEWNCSAPHGAGRAMSRSEARRTLQVDAFVAEMEGIYSTSVGEATLDEAPDAYKAPALIEAAIAGTAVVVDRLRPIHNLKASDEDTQ
ncbi:MAG: hypothetical protein AUK47_09915 [Deltaproteobacteria bacterium CG2_30_63_29]|nr:MAG: hypothetical protein AUK47_09915 [Deltaproteobacteria bacterium CG2_30_63_29]